MEDKCSCRPGMIERGDRANLISAIPNPQSINPELNLLIFDRELQPGRTDLDDVGNRQES